MAKNRQAHDDEAWTNAKTMCRLTPCQIEMAQDRSRQSGDAWGTGYFTDGKTIMWEYPHATPSGERMDFVEVMEVRNGFIQHHRVYWGWFGVNISERDDVPFSLGMQHGQPDA